MNRSAVSADIIECMAESIRQFRPTEQSLNTVGAGLSLAEQIVSALRNGGVVQVDLTAAERMTPSFANALVMTVLDAVGEEEFRARVSVSHSSELVAEAWTKAVQRYARGIRLTTQRPGAA